MTKYQSLASVPRAEPDDGRMPPLRSLLLAVDRRVRRLGARDWLDVERWLRSDPPASHGALRAGLASLLARDPREWDTIASLVDQYLAGGLGSEGQTVRAFEFTVDADAALVPVSTTRARALRRRRFEMPWLVKFIHRHNPQRMPFVIMGLAIAIALGAGTLAFRVEAIIPDASPGIAGAAISPEVRARVEGVPCEVSLQVKSTAKLVSYLALPHLAPRWYAGLSFLTLAFLVLGWRWRHVAEHAVPERRRERAEAAAVSARRREDLDEARAAMGAGPPRLFEVPVFPPAGAEALSISADLLGRARRWSGGRDLDVPATVDRTLAAGGRFDPAFAERGVEVPIVVLLDLEVGDHPYLARIRRILAAWRRLGVRLQVFTFQDDPGTLREEGLDTPLSMHDAVRRSDGQPLLVFSRRLSGSGREGVRPWLDTLLAWAPRAWIDPDALAPTDPSRQDHIAFLGQRGLRRFPLSDAGLVAVSAWLAGRDMVADVPDPGLPSMNDWERDRMIGLWAHVSARVPQPSWDQVDALRRAVPVLAAAFPGPHALSWLLRWHVEHPLNQHREARDAGDQLFQADALVEHLFDWFLMQAGEHPDWLDIGSQVDSLLLDQLSRAPAKGSPDLDLWAYKFHTIRARLDPKRAAALYQELLLGPYREKVLDLLRKEQGRQELLPVEHNWSAEDRGAIAGILDVDDSLRLADLWIGAVGAWPSSRRLLAWIGLLAMAGFVGVLGPPLLVRRGIGVPRAGAMPMDRVMENRRIWPRTSQRPEMVEIVPGTFVLGPASEQHVVTLTQSFALARTEVTQAMYVEVMGENPSIRDYLGVSFLGDELPVQMVSWFDAVRYCNRLSEEEGLPVAYAIDAYRVISNQGADGYRLPTEAEWEYAARAGTTDTWAGTSLASDVCLYGNVADAEAKAVFSDFASGGDCDDGVAGLAPVGSYRPNAWGLFDMTGNVSEWTGDRYGISLSGGTDPKGPATGSSRVFHGGSWSTPSRRARVAERVGVVPSHTEDYIGFRPARSIASSSVAGAAP